MMADAVEASRSLKEYTEENIKEVVKPDRRRQIADGLLKYALTYRDVETIKMYFVKNKNNVPYKNQLSRFEEIASSNPVQASSKRSVPVRTPQHHHSMDPGI